jgi:hypothetical protein
MKKNYSQKLFLYINFGYFVKYFIFLFLYKMSLAKNWLFETVSEPTFIQSAMNYMTTERIHDYKYNCFVEFKNKQKVSALNTYFKKNNVKNAEPTIIYNFDEKNVIKEFGVRTKQGLKVFKCFRKFIVNRRI